MFEKVISIRETAILKKIVIIFLSVFLINLAGPKITLADEDPNSRPDVHDYGKTGDDPNTSEDESEIVANSDVLKSAQYKESEKYKLKANGKPVSVFKYQKSETAGSAFYHMDVARFSSDDKTPIFEVELIDGSTIENVSVYPQRYYSSDVFKVSADKKKLTFQMSEALRYCIVNINGSSADTKGKPQLSIINDPTETDKPDINAANVLDFGKFSKDYLNENPINDVVGEEAREAGEVTDTSLNDETEHTWQYEKGVFQKNSDKEVKFPNKRARLSTDVSEAFQAALKEVKSNSNLDTIYFPAGTYIWSGLSIKEWNGDGADGKLTIYLDEDALLVNRLQECQEAMEPAIGIWNSSNITISGRGIIDGQGTYNYTWDRSDADKTGHQGGSMVSHSQNITFNDTYVRDTKQWNWECHTVDTVTYNNIKGMSPYQHAWVDGLDLTSGKNVTVNGAFTMGNDDTFASGHYNPSDEFPRRRLQGKDLSQLSREDTKIAAAAGIYNRDRLLWDNDDSENFSINNVLGWSPCANSIRLGHNTNWKPEGGSYRMKNYVFNNYNSVLVAGYTSNSGGETAIRVQNGNLDSYPNYDNLVFDNCSFEGNNGNNVEAPAGEITNFNPDSILIKNCWFKDPTKKLSFDSIKNVTLENLYLNDKLVEYSSQANTEFGNNIGKLTFTANGKDVLANTLPVIKYPENKVNAYVGNPCIFFVKAEDADGDTVSFADVDLTGLTGATFDKATGKFSWTPTEEANGKSFDVTFAVSDYTNHPVQKTIKIEVSSAKNSKQNYNVTEDAHMQTWKGEKNNNYGQRNFLSMALIPNQGLLGEKFVNSNTNDGTDGKMTYLKFDLSKMKELSGQFDKAELALAYIMKRDNKLGADEQTQLRVAKVSDSSWNENDITWVNKPEFTATDENVKISDSFKVGADFSDQSKFTADTNVNGTLVKTDIKSFIDESLINNEQYLTLAICEAKGAELYFVSREGAKYFNQATEEMAPSIHLNIPTDLAIEGPEEMTIYQGAGGESNSFALKGEGPFTVELSGNTGDGKITWDNDSRQIKTSNKLAKGKYVVTLNVTNQSNGIKKSVDFTVNVVEDPAITDEKESLQKLYDTNKEKDPLNYTKESWDKFAEALATAKSILENNNATKDEISDAKSALEAAIAGLIENSTEPESISLNVSGIKTLKRGKTFEIVSTISPEGANNAIAWEVNNSAIASIDEKGVLKALKVGTTKIIAKTVNGKSASFTLRVTN